MEPEPFATQVATIIATIAAILAFVPLFTPARRYEEPPGANTVSNSSFFRESVVADFIFVFPVGLDVVIQLLWGARAFIQNLMSDEPSKQLEVNAAEGSVSRMTSFERLSFLVGAGAGSMVLCLPKPSSFMTDDGHTFYLLYICATRCTSVLMTIPLLTYLTRSAGDVGNRVLPLALVIALGAVLSSISYCFAADSRDFTVLSNMGLALVVAACGVIGLYCCFHLRKLLWPAGGRRTRKRSANEHSAVFVTWRQRVLRIQPSSQKLSRDGFGSTHDIKSIKSSTSFDNSSQDPQRFHLFSLHLGLLMAVVILCIVWYVSPPQDGYTAGACQYVVIAIVHLYQMLESRIKTNDAKSAMVRRQTMYCIYSCHLQRCLTPNSFLI
jgi:hypothetical protein